MSAVKVLIVDDSPVVREQAMNMLRKEPDIEVLGIADNKENAREKIAALKPDVITITLRSKKNLSDFIKAITSQISIPVVVMTESDINHSEVEKAGTVTFVKMPLIRTASTMEKFGQRVIQQIKEAAKTKPKPAPAQPTPAQPAPAQSGFAPAQTAPKPPVKPSAEPPAQPMKEPAKPAPEPKAKAPEPAAKAPEPKPKAPEPAAKTPEPKPKPPEPKAAPIPAAKPVQKPAEPPAAAKAVSPSAQPKLTPKVNADQPASKPTVPAEPKSNNIDLNDPAARAMAAATAAKNKLVGSSYPTPRGRHHVIALGASTGGTDALHTVLRDLPADTPGIVIVQHMPEMFTKMYADRLNRSCKMSCVEAVDGERVEVGKIILAAGNYHLRLARDGRGYYVTSQRGEKVSGHCPSVDVLFESVAHTAGSDAIGAIFTGMGADGAIGLKKMRDAGAYTIGQDEKTCVVYGMPMVAYNMGGVCQQAPLDKIAQIILENC